MGDLGKTRHEGAEEIYGGNIWEIIKIFGAPDTN